MINGVRGLLDQFNIDRCGVLLYDAQTQEQVGTWGTDQFGQLRNENNLRFPITPTLIQKPDEGDGGMIVNRHHELQELGKSVGEGWHIQCGIFDNDELLGWLFVDNLVHQRPLATEQIDLIRTYSTAFGQILVKFRQNDLLSQLNLNLESQNDYLNKALKSLASAQERIIEGEKMAALGRLVQGVAHELNTPLGNSLMAVSDFNFSLDECEQKIRADTFSVVEALATLGHLKEAAQLAYSNVKRASQLVGQFKKIAISEEFDRIERIELENFVRQLINNLPKLLTAEIPRFQFELLVPDPHLIWHLLPGAFSQVLTHLIDNAIQHGLKDRDNGLIRIIIDTVTRNAQTKLRVHVSDNGIGVNDASLKVLFDPFFTTNRQTGSGLGASIVYNLVTHRMGGSIQAKHNPGGGLLFEILLPDLSP